MYTSGVLTPPDGNSKLALFSLILYWLLIGAALWALTLYVPSSKTWPSQVFYVLVFINFLQIAVCGWVFKRLIFLIGSHGSGWMWTLRSWRAMAFSLVYLAGIGLLYYAGHRYMHSLM